MFSADLGVTPSSANYIEDVFSTYLYTGNGSTQTITNGIDLAGKGGMIWTKRRDGAADHAVSTTSLGTYVGNPTLRTNSTLASANEFAGSGTYNSNGYTLPGSEAKYNVNNYTYVSWTFRKQAKFFDVVTYTGTGFTEPNISHSLGSVPGCIIIKRTDSTGNWFVYHRTIGTSGMLVLNSTAASAANNMLGATPTATTFKPAGDADILNATYVAYLFAHDAGGFGATGSDNVITCGSYTGNGSATGPTVTLGYEPQWLLIRRTDAAARWLLVDNMRGFPVGGTDNLLEPQDSAAENGGYGAGNWVDPLATGFQPVTITGGFNASGGTYIYIAIRRGPMKTPTTGTSVFSPVTQTGTGAAAVITHGITVDTWIASDRNNTSSLVGYKQAWFDRLLGNADGFVTSSNAAWGGGWGNSYFKFDNNVGVPITGTFQYLNYTGTPYVYWGFSRAPGFFDMVCYTGTGSNLTLNHNLGVVPDLIISKARSTTSNWGVYLRSIGDNSGNGLLLNNTSGTGTYDPPITAASATTFQARAANFGINGTTYASYLFATVAGVSKVGSYTGTGTTNQINCGFTGGARFVLIKRTDSTGDWYVWDSARGIVAGNDPYLLFNSIAAEVTSTDYVDTYSAGFEISSTAPAAINANGGSFIFLAIA